MTSIVQLEDNFPETACFHDSIITNIDIDYEKNMAVINIKLCSGDPESSEKWPQEFEQAYKWIICYF